MAPSLKTARYRCRHRRRLGRCKRLNLGVIGCTAMVTDTSVQQHKYDDEAVVHHGTGLGARGVPASTYENTIPYASQMIMLAILTLTLTLCCHPNDRGT